MAADFRTDQRVSTPGSTIVFLNMYGPDVSAEYKREILAAEKYIQDRFTGPTGVDCTFKILFDTKNEDDGSGASNSFSSPLVVYSELRAALVARAAMPDASADDKAAASSLPLADPSQGLKYALSVGTAVILGLRTPDQLSAKFDTISLNLFLSPGETPYAYNGDVMNAIFHEITEGVMGRTGNLGINTDDKGVVVGTPQWGIMDLFRVDANGNRNYTAVKGGVDTYLTIDGKTPIPYAQFDTPITVVGNKRINSGADTCDYSQFSPASVANDSFGYGKNGVPGTISEVDLRTLDILGWTRRVEQLADDFANDLTDKVAPIGVISVNQTLIGNIGTKADVDTFSIKLTAGKTYTVEVQGMSTNHGSLADPMVGVFDSARTQLGSNDDVSTSNLDARFTATAPYTGTYYLGVADSDFTATGTYTIKVFEVVTDDYASSLSGGSSPIGQLAVNGVTRGSIEGLADRDWFSIYLTSGAHYQFDMQGQYGGYGTLKDPYLRLYNSSGSVLLVNDDIIKNGANPDAQLEYAPTTSGYYYIAAGAYGDSSTGTYQVKSTLLVPSDDFADGALDNTSPRGVVTVGIPLKGSLEVLGDKDYFSVQLIGNTKYIFDLQGLSSKHGTLADPYLTIYNSSGVSRSNDDLIEGGTNGDSRIEITALATGTYYILASAYGDYSYGTYQITVTAVPVDDYADVLDDSSAPIGALTVNGSRTGTLAASDRDLFAAQLTAGVSYTVKLQGASSSSGTLPDPYLSLYTSAGVLLNENDDVVEGGRNTDSQLTFTPQTTATYYLGATSYDEAESGSYKISLATVATVNTVTGTIGNDRLLSTSANDTINGLAGTDTAVFAGSLSNYRITYNRALGSATVTDHRTSGDGTDSLISIEKLQFADKTFDLLNPARTESAAFGKSQSFLFDPAFYLLKNPDLVPTVTMATAFDSYKSKGAAAGAAPNAWFDPVYYANRWTDLKSLNLDAATLFAHYNLYGVWEGRSAGPSFDKFDGTKYLKDNPDVAAYVDAYVKDFLGSRSNGAIAHYVIYGANEGRLAYDTAGVVIEQAILIGTP